MTWIDCGTAAAAVHRHMCEHDGDDGHGYTQGGGRWGDGSWESIDAPGGPYDIQNGDRDCSSSVIDAWSTVLSKADREGCLDGATYTGNMRSVFVGSGLFDWHPMSDGYIAQAGDVYLNEVSHTAMCQSADPDELSEFSLNEFGGIVGGQQGDQTGYESRVRSYYDFPWDGILAYNHGADYDDEEDDMSADDVWNFDQNGTLMRDRIQGTDEAANGALREAAGANAAAGAAREQLTRTDDVSGRKTEANLYERVCWLGKRTEEQGEQLAAIDSRLDALTQKLDTVLGKL